MDMNKFMKMEKIEPLNIPGIKFVESVSEIDGKESIAIPVNKAQFYEIYDVFEDKVENFKIYNTKDQHYWICEVEECQKKKK